MTAGPLATPDDLASYQSGNEQSLLDQATALVRSYCGWHVAPSLAETITVDGSGSMFLSLPSLHVISITSVTEAGTLLDAGSYEWSVQGQLWRSTPWAGAYRSVVVELVHGYDEAPVLTAVVMAVVSRAQKSPAGEVRVQVGPFSETYSQSGFNQAGGLVLLDAEKAVLDRYRLPSRP